MVRWRAVPEVRLDLLNLDDPPIYRNYQWGWTSKPRMICDKNYCRKSRECVVLFHAEVGHPDGLVPASKRLPTNKRKRNYYVGFSGTLRQNVGVAP